MARNKSRARIMQEMRIENDRLRRKLVNVHIRGDFENPDKPLELKDTKFAAMNPDTTARIEQAMQGYTEEQILSSMKSVLEPVYEERRKQQELFDAALLRTVCKKYTAITGKHAVDLTHGILEDFRAVYDSVYGAVFTEVFLRSPEEYWRMAMIQLDSDWGEI